MSYLAHFTTARQAARTEDSARLRNWPRPAVPNGST
ncbi:hypothetical protein SMA5143A_4832 [Streptomyces sp. MA5143a]|nr:hypothetical protein SMA5143A_4832 [Streptomyces sp. MA5143a]